MHWTISHRTLAFALAVGLAAVGGCSPPRYDVTGKVTYNGAPLNHPDGQIVFVGPTGDQVSAAIGADGTYRATGVVSGTNRVAVFYPNPAAKPDKGQKLKPGEQMRNVPTYLTPAKYATPDTSELTVGVDKGTEYNVDLTGPPIKDPTPARPGKEPVPARSGK